MKKALLIMFLFAAANSFAEAEAVKCFDEIWQIFYQKSYLIQAARDEQESSSLAFDRANRHWFPRAFISGQVFSTDDPGQIFFNNLGQRSITPVDFVPSSLNNPKKEIYQVGTIGLQLPLYEGGSKVAQSSMMELILQARVLEIEARKTKEYAELVKRYGEVLISSKSADDLVNLKEQLSKIMTTYQVGAKSSPVGYSGLLGLKAVHHRILGLMAKFRLQIESDKFWIAKKVDINASWTPDLSSNLATYLEKNLENTFSHSNSSLLMANLLEVNALGKMREVEQARFLPQIGLFAQNNLYNGARDFQNSQMFGINLTWDLFNNDSYGRIAETRAKYRGAEAKIAAARQDEMIAHNNLAASKAVLEENIKLLSDTDTLLKEQTINAMKLFKSGLISALQLSEVINRRVDLTENKSNAENQYLEVMTNIYQIHH
ncbi:MAG: TolC family protein [Bdellovibrionota bacterium]